MALSLLANPHFSRKKKKIYLCFSYTRYILIFVLILFKCKSILLLLFSYLILFIRVQSINVFIYVCAYSFKFLLHPSLSIHFMLLIPFSLSSVVISYIQEFRGLLFFLFFFFFFLLFLLQGGHTYVYMYGHICVNL